MIQQIVNRIQYNNYFSQPITFLTKHIQPFIQRQTTPSLRQSSLKTQLYIDTFLLDSQLSIIYCYNQPASMRLSLLLDNQIFRDIRKKQFILNTQQKYAFKQLFRRHENPNFLAPQFYRMIAFGVPSQYRSTVWKALIPNIYNITQMFYSHVLIHLAQQQALFGLKYERERTAPIEEMKTTQDDRSQEEIERQRAETSKTNKLFKALKNIETDLPRTLPELKETHIDSEWYVRLTRLLGAFAIIREDISYVQGMSQIVALLQLQFNNEVDTFSCLTTLLSATPLNDFYTFNESIISSVCENVVQVINKLSPQVGQFLRVNQIQPKIYVVNWIMTMYTRIFQFDSILVIWDILLANNVSRKVLQQLCGAIVCGRRKAILQSKNASKAIKLLLHSKLQINEEDWVLQYMRSFPRTF